MHGILFLELHKFAISELGTAGWRSAQTASGLRAETYLASKTYPDEDLVARVVAVAEASKKDVDSVLQAFGAFIVPDLVATYGPFIDPSWKTLDLLANTEEQIHKAVRLNTPGATPPDLRIVRDGPSAVVLTYSSARKLCAVAKGIAAGVAAHFGERMVITEARCQHQGAASCEIRFEVTG